MLERWHRWLATLIDHLKLKMANRCRFAIPVLNQLLMGLIPTRALPLVALRRELMLFDVATVTFMPPVKYGASDKD